MSDARFENLKIRVRRTFDHVRQTFDFFLDFEAYNEQ